MERMDPNVLKNICRICMTSETDVLMSLLSKFNEETIANAVEKCAGIEIQPNDNMPQNICETCFKDLVPAFFFVKRVRASDEILSRLFKCRSTVSLIRMECESHQQGGREPIKFPSPGPDTNNCDPLHVANAVIIHEEAIGSHDYEEKYDQTEDDKPILEERPNSVISENQEVETKFFVELKDIEKKEGISSNIQPPDSPIDNSHFEEPLVDYSDHEEETILLKELPVLTIHDTECKAHIKEIKINGNVCCSHRCYKMFPDEEARKEHVDDRHRSKRYKKANPNLICKICYAVFTKASLFESHKEFLKHEEYILECDICKIRCLGSRRKNIMIHIRNHFENGKLKEQAIQPKVENADEYMNEINVDGITCCGVRCYATFQSIEEFTIHAEGAHSKKRYNDERPLDLKCEKCYTVFMSKEQYDKHIQETTNIKRLLECAICKARSLVSSKKFLRQHINDHIKNGILNTTEKKTVGGSGYNIDELKTIYGFLCCGQGCQLSFDTNEDLVKHAHKDHINTKILNKARAQSKPHECNICFKRFDKVGRLIDHHRRKYIEQHTATPCESCGKKVKRTDMETHMAKHNDERKFICDTCGKTFLNKIKVRAHVKTHLTFTDLKCNICGFKFKQKTYLNFHMLKHKKIYPFSCKLCPVKCRSRFDLKEHNRTHTGERPFKCSFCDQAFSDKSNLRIHEVLHTQQYPYNCTKCGKGFMRKSNFVSHKH